MALATATTVTSLFLPSDIVLPFYQASHMPRSLPQLALESLEVFTSAVGLFKSQVDGVPWLPKPDTSEPQIGW
jgi:hypothetical protein